MKQTKCDGARGRPRCFDIDEALERALQVFWQKGYEGASLSDLTEAMQISRPSLYAAFGNKETLFQKALERYSNGPAAYVHESLKAPTAREVVERMLCGAITLLSNPCNPTGCLSVQGALSCGDSAQPIRQELISWRTAGEIGLRERLERAKSEGDLPPDSSPIDLARYIATVIEGMSVQAAGGANREELQRVAQLTLKAWPG